MPPPDRHGGKTSPQARSDDYRQLERDLSTCTLAEMEKRWSVPDRNRIIASASRQKKREIDWPEICLPTHNPIIYSAQRAFFSNPRAAGNPKFLYLPYHLNLMCDPILKYILDPDPLARALNWLGPRDTYKSTFNHGVIPFWFCNRLKWLFNIDARIVLRHHKEELAARNMLRLKAKYLHQEWTRRVWSDACPPAGTKDFGTITQFTLPWKPETLDEAEPTFRAIGVTGVDTGSHADLDCGDDLVTEAHITSRTIRRDSELRYDARRFQLDPEGREVNTGTPYHPSDLWSWMENAEDDDGNKIYQFIRVKAVKETCPDCDHITVPPMGERGVGHLRHGKCEDCGCESTAALAHPGKLSWKFLHRRRAEEVGRKATDSMWQRQYQCQIISDADFVGDSTWFRECSVEDIPPGAFPVLIIDPAWKGTTNQGEGDSAAIQQWFIERRRGMLIYYLSDGVHSNMLTSLEGEQEIFRLVQKWGTRLIAPEEHGGQTFRTSLRNTAISLGLSVSVIDLKLKQTEKNVRMVEFLKVAQAGRIYVCKECPTDVKQALFQQTDNFHPEMDDDDALDCAAYTQDGNIAKNHVPVWGSGLRDRMKAVQEIAGQDFRTRHTMS